MRKSILFFAAAAALLSACNKNVPESNICTVDFVASEIGTKTEFDTPSGNKYPVLWREGDKVDVTLNLANTSSVEVTPSADRKSATFKYTFTSEASNTFVIYYPAGSVKSFNTTNQTLNVEIPAAQTSTAIGPDPAAQMLVYVSDEMSKDEIPAQLSAKFVHMTAYGHLKFSNVNLGDATVTGVNISASTNFIGRYFFWNNHNAGDAKIGEWSGGDVSPNAVGSAIAISTTTLDDVWFSAAPVDLSGQTLKIVVATDKGTLSKEITLPANSKLTSGKIAKMTIDMTGITMESPKVYAPITNANNLAVDDIVIIGARDYDVAIGTTQNGNNRAAAGVSKDGNGAITNPGDGVQIFKVEAGTVNGTFAFKCVNGDKKDNYIYAAGNTSKNYLRSTTTKGDTSSWAITITDEGNSVYKTRIVAQTTSGYANIIKYNNSGTNNLFSAYKESTNASECSIFKLQ